MTDVNITNFHQNIGFYSSLPWFKSLCSFALLKNIIPHFNSPKNDEQNIQKKNEVSAATSLRSNRETQGNLCLLRWTACCFAYGG